MKNILLLILFLYSFSVNSQNIVITPTTAPLGYASTTIGSLTNYKFYYGNWKDSLNMYLFKSDTSMLARKTSIPTNTNQLVNGSGFLTKSITDTYYKPISYVPTWGDVMGKPTFSTVAISGSYNDLSNKPAIVQQLGVTYTKEFNGEIATNTGTNSYSITATGITTITNVSAIGFYSGANTQSAPLIAISSISGNVVTFVVSESATTSVLIGGTMEGLTEFLKVGKIYVTIKGN